MWDFWRGIFGRRSATARRPVKRVEIDLGRVDSWIEVEQGFPRANWDAIGEYIRIEMKPQDVPGAWTEAAARWLGEIKRHLQGNYDLYETESFLLLSYQPAQEVQRMAQIAERAYKYLFDVLDGTAETDRVGKLGILILDGPELYDAYVNYFGERETASLGVFIDSGYAHLALDGTVHGGVEGTLVHELAHGMLSGLHLPRWIDEGVAQIAEELANGRQILQVNREIRDEHLAYWREQGLDAFWNGEAFDRSGSTRLAYQLAEILVRNILSERRKRFPHFLLNASRDDGGAEAARSCFGVTLGQIAATFLGDGDWESGRVRGECD